MTTKQREQEATSALTTTQPLTSIEALGEAWRERRGKANLLSPVASIDSIPALHGISLRSVMIDPTVNKYGQGPEVYRDGRFEDDEVALGAVALQKISAAAGIQPLGQKRLDSGSEPYYCNISVTIGMRDYDGMYRRVTKSKELDLRDGAPGAITAEKKQGHGDKYPRKTGRMIALEPSVLAERRSHIQSVTETKAFHRAVRSILNLKQKYTTAELKRPFVVPKLVPMLDPSDPDQKKALIDMATGRGASLYGHDGGEVRELKGVTPAPAESPSTPVDVDEKDAPEEVINEEDFEPLDFPEQKIFVCSCPCGDQVEITEKVARITEERCGAPRCVNCFPGRRFAVDQHREFADLALPKHPGLTAERIEAGLKGGAK